MDIFDLLSMIGGLSLFLFGMNLMGEALERVGDHCSNIAGCVVDMAHHDLNTHEALRSAREENAHFGQQYKDYAKKYSLK